MSVGPEIQIICVIMTWLNNLGLPATDENVIGIPSGKVENVKRISSVDYAYTRVRERLKIQRG